MSEFLNLFDKSFFTPFNTTLVAFLVFLSYKIYKQDVDSFKYVFYAWIANIVFLITTFFVAYFKGKKEWPTHEVIDYFTYYLDLISSLFIFLAYLAFKRRSLFNTKTITVLLITVFSIVVFKYLFSKEFIMPFELFSHVLSVTTLFFFLALIINVFRQRFKRIPVLIIIGVSIYLLIHAILVVNIYMKIDYILLMDFFAIIAKALILYGFFQFFVFNQNLIKEEEIDRRAEEKRLNEALEKSDNLNNELNEILGWTFHELSSPKISLGSTLLTLSETNKSRDDIIERIKSICLREFNLFESVIDASQKMYIDANPALKDANLAEKVKYDYHNVNTAIQMAVLSFKKKNTSEIDGLRVYNEAIDFELDYGGNCIAYISSEFKLIGLFTNLIKNSFQAAPKGEVVTIYIKTRIKKLDDGKQKIIVIEFEDNGPGIEQEIQEEVFNRGFSTKLADKDTPVRGIGLYVVKETMKENNGEVILESPPRNPHFDKTSDSKGTKFILTLHTQPFNIKSLNNGDTTNES